MVNDKPNDSGVSCQQVWHEISNYLENDLDASQRAAMDEHLRGCSRCRSVLDGTRNIIRLYGDERMIEVPSGYSRRLEHRLAQSARMKASARWSSWNSWMIPVAALLLFVGGLRLANSRSSEPLKSEHAQQAQGIPPDMPVIITAGAKVFHAAGCPFIHNKPTERTMTAREAMDQGYVPCLRCMRKYLDVAAAQPGRNWDEDDDVDADSSASAKDDIRGSRNQPSAIGAHSSQP